MRRQRSPGAGKTSADGPVTAAQWTEGETTRLLSSAELPGLYLLRPRFLSKAENVVYLLLKAAFPRHEIFARVRLADVRGLERLVDRVGEGGIHGDGDGVAPLRPRHGQRQDGVAAFHQHMGVHRGSFSIRIG